MQKRLVTRYAMKSAEAADENQRRVDEVNPIASTAAFAHFQDDHADRRDGGVDQQTASLVGAFITTIG
jgi:hypothetical protein